MKKKFNEDWINGGFMICKKSIFKFFKKKNAVFEEDILPKISSLGKLYGYKHNGFWYPIDTLKDKRVVTKLWKSNKAPWKIW